MTVNALPTIIIKLDGYIPSSHLIHRCTCYSDNVLYIYCDSFLLLVCSHYYQ